MTTEDLVGFAIILAVSGWCLRPVLQFSSLDSADPRKPVPLSFKLITAATVLVPLMAGFWAHRAGNTPLAATLFMAHLGALFGCTAADPTHISRRTFETALKYAVRFVIERLQRMIRPKLAAVAAALAIPFIFPESHWAFAGMAASLAFIPGKGLRLWHRLRSYIPDSRIQAEEKFWMDFTMEVLAKAHLLAMGPVLYLLQSSTPAPAWSALAGYTLFAAIVVLGSMLLGLGGHSEA